MKGICIIAISALVLAVSLLPMNEAAPSSQVQSRQKRGFRVTCWNAAYWNWRSRCFGFRLRCRTCWNCRRKRDTTTSMDDVKELEQMYMNYTMEDFFDEADGNCDGFIDCAEWHPYGSAADFMTILGLFDSNGDELLTREELSTALTEVEVEMMIEIPMKDFEEMLDNQGGDGDGDGEGGEDDGGSPKDRKMSSGESP